MEFCLPSPENVGRLASEKRRMARGIFTGNARRAESQPSLLSSLRGNQREISRHVFWLVSRRGGKKFPARFPCAFPRFAQWLRARTLRTITEARPRPILTDFRLPENVAAGFNAGCRIKKNPHENELPMMKIADSRECQTFFGDFFAECLREISSVRNIFQFLPP